MADEVELVYNVDQYLWMVVIGTIFGFMYAFGIGANDVANAFASTVASGSLTLKQAIFVAAIFEFCGAYFLGAQVTSTIRSKIFDVNLYEDEPEVLMLGMFTSLFTAMIMLAVATVYGLPVSTTHTVVGCIMGFSIVAKGFDSIDWEVARKIFYSWLASPGVSGAVAFVFFACIKYFVLESENPYQRAYWTFPLVITAGVGIDLFYILNKGLANLDDYKLDGDLKKTLSIGFGTGAACALIWVFIIGPIAKKRVEMHVSERQEAALAPATEKFDSEQGSNDKADPTDQKEMEESSDDVKDPEAVKDAEVKEEPEESNEEDKGEVEETSKRTSSFARLSKKFGDMTYNQDLKTISLNENAKAAHIWEQGEMFDPHAEQLFTYIQVFTACLNSFAHGANDVANAIAPISALIDIYQTGQVSSKAPVDKWILAYGGIGIVVGLLLYGYQVMKSLGYKMTILSPSRGSCAELAASLFVVTASYLKMPVSSTQSICGAVLGVGLVGGIKNVQWWFFLRVCTSWVVIFFGACICSAGVFALMAFSPSIANPVLPETS